LRQILAEPASPSDRPAAEQKVAADTTKKAPEPVFDQQGNEITQNPSEELKAARQRAGELRAAELFLSTPDAQKGEEFTSSSGDGTTNIDPTTGKPITRERAEEIRDREEKRGSLLRSATRAAAEERDRLEREEAPEPRMGGSPTGSKPQSRELDILDQINAFEKQQGETFLGSSASPEFLNFLSSQEGFEGIAEGDREAQQEINKVINDRYKRRQRKGRGDNAEKFAEVDKDIRAEALPVPPVPEKPVGPVQPDRLSPEEETARLKAQAAAEGQFVGGNNIRPSAKVSEEEQQRLTKRAKGGGQFVGAGLSESDPEKREQARARREAELKERRDAAQRGVRGAFYKQQAGQDLSIGGTDGIARPGQLPPQDLSRGGADGIALANQTPPANLTQLEGNRNARAQAGGETIENNQQLVQTAQQLTEASQTFSQSIANSVQLLNESPFITQLTKASEVLSSLPEMKITLNAQVKPVEVILNGGALIQQMKEEAKAEILQAVGEKIANLTNPDGSIRNDGLS
jgi:hypothetical protein